jgi:hypothetical protein
MTQPPLSIADRVQALFELHELGVAMVRQRFVRQNPDASDTELDDLVAAWLLKPSRAADGGEFAWRSPGASGGR